MPRRLPRFAFILIVFFLLIVTFNLRLKSERELKLRLNSKLSQNQLLSLIDNPLHLLNARMYPQAVDYSLKDWHDHEFMAYEASREGPGENGTAVFLTEPNEIKLNDELREVEGLNVLISDKISVNRSLPDVRHPK